MDELEMLTKFRDRVPELDPEGLRAARLALLGRARTAGAPARLRQRNHRARRRWAIPAAVAMAAVALAVALPVILPGGGPGGAGSAEARAALHRIALVAAARRAEAPPGPGQYYYTRAQAEESMLFIPGHGLANFEVTGRSTEESWIGTDGSGRTVTTDTEMTFPSPEDRAAWVAAGSPDLVGMTGARDGDTTEPPGGLYFLDLSVLPTDPDSLKAVIEERKIVGGPGGDWETFAIIGEMLQETYAPPALRAALYDVAANLPGVVYVGTVTDAAGRPGLGVAYTHGGIRDELVFDPNTAQLLATNSWLVDPGAVGIDVAGEAPGTAVAYAGRPGLVYSAVYLASGVVDSTQERP